MTMELLKPQSVAEIDDEVPMNCSLEDNDVACNTISLPVTIVYSILILFIFILSNFGNSIVCLIVFKKPSMRSAINLLLATLAVSHILLALLCLPFALTTLITTSWLLGNIMCKLNATIFMLLVSQSTFILLAISVDRYLIIVLRRDKLTTSKAKILIGVLWLVALSVAIAPCFGWAMYTHYTGWIQCGVEEAQNAGDISYIVIAFSVVFYLPMIIMAFCYLRIYHKVRTNLRKIANYPAVLNTATAAKLGLHLSMQPPPNVDMSFKTRAFKTIFMLYIVSLICWTPYSLCVLVWNLKGSIHIHYTSGSWVLIFGYLNTAVNPVIYFWRIHKFREACAELFPKLVKWIPGFKVRTRRRINPSRAYEVCELPTVSNPAL